MGQRRRSGSQLMVGLGKQGQGFVFLFFFTRWCCFLSSVLSFVSFGVQQNRHLPGPPAQHGKGYRRLSPSRWPKVGGSTRSTAEEARQANQASNSTAVNALLLRRLL